MLNIKTKDVLAYTTMPRIFPRVKGFLSSGFSYISFLMAHIYFMARLLPANHPYLVTSNMGRFGIRNVISEATRNLKFSYKNTDQIIIYFAMLAGVVMLAAQICVLMYALIISPAMAFSWFDTPVPATDIAYNLLDRVFGIPNVYCSSYTPANCTDYSVANVLPMPFHVALHGLFRFYSTALLLIAVLIFLYFVVVIVLETAATGSPFGQRFQNVWVPIRLVVALGLLMPINYGINSGQYIVLYAAKWGSSFASTGWTQFNQEIANHAMFGDGSNGRPIGEKYTMLAIPEAPDIAPIIEAMSIVHACAYSYHRLVAEQENQQNPGDTDYDVYNANYTDSSSEYNFRIQPYLVKKKEASFVDGAIGSSPIIGDDDLRVWLQDAGTKNYMDALGFYFGGNIIIRFGEYAIKEDGNDVHEEEGGVAPLCGDIVVPVVDLRDPGGALADRGGADAMLQFYYETVLKLWFDDVEIRQFARSYVESTVQHNNYNMFTFCSDPEVGGAGSASGTGTGFPGFWGSVPECSINRPTADWRQEKIDLYQTELIETIRVAWGDHVMNSIYENLNDEVIAYGWGGAGIWYNKIAEVNGGWIDGVAAVPHFETYPLTMEEVKAFNLQHNESLEVKDTYDPTVKAQSGEDSSSKHQIKNLITVAEPLSAVYSYWNEDLKDFDNTNRVTYKNIIMDSMNRLLGTNGLAEIRASNAHLHPLAQLVMVGKGLVDSAILNLAGSTGTAFLGGMLGAMGVWGTSSALLTAASEVLLSTAFMGLTVGFVLFYILPFLPFVYFYFAVASWLKTIFEAMVGVPLWALAHLRIDGEGLPGEAAQNGYFLILEIFIRPILTVFGLVAAVIIFSTQVRILNLIWDLVTVNASGYTLEGDNILAMGTPQDVRFQRGIVDQFFFTVIYTIICYMLALASFKLIDRIPDNILRWIGSSASAFSDINQENVDSLSSYASRGGLVLGNQAAGAMNQLGGGAGRAVGSELGQVVNAPKVK